MLFADFGETVTFGAATATAMLLRAGDADAVIGDLTDLVAQRDEDVLWLEATDFTTLKATDTVTIGGTTYVVRKVALIFDGAIKEAVLVEQT